MSKARSVFWGKRVAKQLDTLPDFIQRKFYAWATAVELAGIRVVRERPGFHDEPLKGGRQGQRSIRLNRAYRAIYVERSTGELELIEVIEVNKHEY